MRKSAFIVLAPAALLLVAAVALAPRPASAGYNLPWCATYYDNSGVRSCAFASYGQCMETISGIGGLCSQNPLYSPPPPNVDHVKRRRAKLHPGDDH